MTKNKLGFVKGSCKKPDSDSHLLSLWQRSNSMVLSWLLHSVVAEIGESIVYCDSAFEIWEELKQRYGKTNGAKIFQIQRELCQISQENLYVELFHKDQEFMG